MELILGGTGFLGAHLAAYLIKKGKDVAIFHRASSSKFELEKIFYYHFNNEYKQKLANIHYLIGDISDPFSIEKALNQNQNVYNCTGFVSFDPKYKNNVIQINQNFQEQLVNVLLNSNIRKYCHVSSIAALGRMKESEIINEESFWEADKLNTLYSYAKYKGELQAWRAYYEGLNTVIVNPGVILGVGDWNKGVCKLFRLVDKGLAFYTNGISGYVGVDDVVKAMDLVTDSDVSGERYVLVSENITYKCLFEEMAYYLEKKPPYIHANLFLRQTVIAFDYIKSLMLQKSRTYSNEFARLAGAVSMYSSEKFSNKFQYAFEPISETIKKTCEFYKEDMFKT